MKDKSDSTPRSTSLAIPSGIIKTAADLGEAIRKFRRQKGWTLTEAAGLSGVGIRFLSELERGKATAELGKVLQVVQRVGLNLRLEPRGAGRDERGNR